MGLTEASAFKDNSINTADLSSDTTDDTKRAVTTNHIRDNAVTTAKVADLNVTTAKLANSTGTSDGVTTAKIADGAITQAKINSAVIFTPVGTVITYAGATAPAGYLKANGDTIPNGSGTVQGVTHDFSALYAVVGSALPDLRGEFIRGFDDGKGTDSGRLILSNQTDQNKEHNHTATSSVNESNHSHGITDNGHYHYEFRSGNAGANQNQSSSNLTTSNYPGSGTGPSNKYEGYNIWGVNNPPNRGRSQTKSTGISINAQSTGITVSTTTANDGGNESRPKNIALLMCIKY
tara:strand:- start:917 stop:1792 length:876 start_codon:yes stop_codon:yes gene_type:complete